MGLLFIFSFKSGPGVIHVAACAEAGQGFQGGEDGKDGAQKGGCDFLVCIMQDRYGCAKYEAYAGGEAFGRHVYLLCRQL